MRTRSRRVVAVVFGAFVAAVTTTTASAHATYESSDPPDGGRVASPPSQVTADFSEPLIAADSYMRVTDRCGRDVGGETTVTADTMTVQMSGEAAGRYTVSWRAHSSVDNHVTTGDFSFTSSGGRECPGEEKDRTRRGGGGGGGSSSQGAAGSGSGDSSSSARAGSSDRAASGSRGDGRGGGGTKKDRSGGDSRANDRNDGEDTTALLAGVAQADVPDAPSALEGIPLKGLLITLAVAALIGAAAGKIYVSLSGDEP